MFQLLKVGGEGSCYGDSGGPLVIYDTFAAEPHYIQVGVVRGTSGECGDNNFPDIYGRLENFDILSWINRFAFGRVMKNKAQRTTSSSSSNQRVSEDASNNCKRPVFSQTS